MICFYPPQFFESFLIVIPFVVFVFNFLFLFFPCIESISFIIYMYIYFQLRSHVPRPPEGTRTTTKEAENQRHQ